MGRYKEYCLLIVGSGVCQRGGYRKQVLHASVDEVSVAKLPWTGLKEY